MTDNDCPARVIIVMAVAGPDTTPAESFVQAYRVIGPLCVAIKDAGGAADQPEAFAAGFTGLSLIR